MKSFPSQNDKTNFFATGRVYSKKQTGVKANRHIFKSGLISSFSRLLTIAVEFTSKLKQLFIWTTKSGGTKDHKHKNYVIIHQ